MNDPSVPPQQASFLQGVTVKSAAKYALLPGIFPRLRRLAGSLGQFMFMFTQIFGAVGLINKNHPCLRPENIGRYKFTDIVGLAAQNVIFDKKHLPQTAMFFAVIGSLLLLAAIVATFILSIAMKVSANPAQAQFFGSSSEVGYSPSNDWAFIFLNRLFGGSDTTGLAFWTGAAGGSANNVYTNLFVSMLSTYSLALLVIAAFMIIYLLIITVAESARSGEPFGSRFDSVWAPIRLALAIGLLIPISGQGYNGAQLITFQVAEWGSNLATNVWHRAINSIGNQGQFVGMPTADMGIRFVRDAYQINTCMAGYNIVQKESIIPLAAFPTIVNPPLARSTTVVFGPPLIPGFCGSIAVPNFIPATTAPAAALALPNKIIGTYRCIVNKYFGTSLNTGGATCGTSTMKNDSLVLTTNAIAVKDKTLESLLTGNQIENYINTYWNSIGFRGPGTPFFNGLYTAEKQAFNTWIVDQMKADARYGWSTAGVFYIRLSSAFDLLNKAAKNSPSMVTATMPLNAIEVLATGAVFAPGLAAIAGVGIGTCMLMEDTLIGKLCPGSIMAGVKLNRVMTKVNTRFTMAPHDNPGLAAKLGGATNYDLALAGEQDQKKFEGSSPKMASNAITDTIISYLAVNSDNINPLGTVVQWGNNLMALGGALFGLATVGGLLGLGAAQAFVSLLTTLAGLMFFAGFMLAVVVPMMPFLYFMFAVIEWMISILEAVIGMPLWALSFISLEGDALGKAMTGVMKLFEIMLRPTIIIMALVGSMLIFIASIQFLNDMLGLYRSASSATFGEATTTGGAFSSWFGSGVSSIAQIFIYMFAVYSMANSSFKLIDTIPNQFMGWINGPNGFGSGIKAGLDDVNPIVLAGAAGKISDGLVTGVSGLSKKKPPQGGNTPPPSGNSANALTDSGNNPPPGTGSGPHGSARGAPMGGGSRGAYAAASSGPNAPPPRTPSSSFVSAPNIGGSSTRSAGAPSGSSSSGAADAPKVMTKEDARKYEKENNIFDTSYEDVTNQPSQSDKGPQKPQRMLGPKKPDTDTDA